MASHDVRSGVSHARESRQTDALSVVLPAYNEGSFVRSAVEHVLAASRHAEWPVRIIVVDDGSSDPESIAVLDEVARLAEVDLVRQPNSGRFLARQAGLARVTTDYVLLLDARVEVEVESLARIRAAVNAGAEVWNYDVTPASRDPRALFWTGITKVWWRTYFRDRRRVSFGPDTFDLYPKGTGAFFVPTEILREAVGGFESHYADASLASDDTRLLRNVAAASPINLAPEIMCRHHAKVGPRQFSRQCYFRGTTFVDGYLGERERARPLLAGAAIVTGVGLVTAIKAPRFTAAVTAAGVVSAAGLTRWVGGTPREAASVGALAPAFGVLFGAGAIRGLRMAAAPRER